MQQLHSSPALHPCAQRDHVHLLSPVTKNQMNALCLVHSIIDCHEFPLVWIHAILINCDFRDLRQFVMSSKEGLSTLHLTWYQTG